MNYLKTILLLFLIGIMSCEKSNTNNSTEVLGKIIDTYQDHKGYDKKEYPLGLFTKEYYKGEAEFATSILDKLSEVHSDDLNETDKISLELLKFKLQDAISYYEFERYLNP